MRLRSISKDRAFLFQGLNGADNCNTCTKYWNTNAWVMSIYTVYVHILFLILLFHLNISTVKKKTVVLKLLKINVFLYIKVTYLAKIFLFGQFSLLLSINHRYTNATWQNKTTKNKWLTTQIFMFYSWMSRLAMLWPNSLGTDQSLLN